VPDRFGVAGYVGDKFYEDNEGAKKEKNEPEQTQTKKTQGSRLRELAQRHRGAAV
jgi:hypothetical protein